MSNNEMLFCVAIQMKWLKKYFITTDFSITCAILFLASACDAAVGFSDLYNQAGPNSLRFPISAPALFMKQINKNVFITAIHGRAFVPLSFLAYFRLPEFLRTRYTNEICGIPADFMRMNSPFSVSGAIPSRRCIVAVGIVPVCSWSKTSTNINAPSLDKHK